MTLNWMQAVVQTTLGPAKATVQTRVQARTPTGGQTFTWVPGDWSYCNIAPMSARDIDLAGRMNAIGTVTCRISAILDVDPHDQIVISDTGADELDGRWEVTAILTGYPIVDRLLYLARLENQT